MSERARLSGDAHEILQWRRWGPYLADRAWGTVREDYSAERRRVGLPAARSGAVEGVSLGRGRHRRLLRSLSDPLLGDGVLERARPDPERALLRPHPDRGEPRRRRQRVLLLRRRLPSHAYQRMLYKYPQRAFPYVELIEENEHRGSRDAEFELIDTGIFDDSRYFDIEIEIAKEDAETMRLPRHRAQPRSRPRAAAPDPAPLVSQYLVVERREPADAEHHRHATAGCSPTIATRPPLAGLLASTHVGPHKLQLPPEARTALHRKRDAHGARLRTASIARGRAT